MKRTTTDIVGFVTITNFIITLYTTAKIHFLKQMKATAFGYHSTTLTAVEPSTEPPNFSTEPQPIQHEFKRFGWPYTARFNRRSLVVLYV